MEGDRGIQQDTSVKKDGERWRKMEKEESMRKTGKHGEGRRKEERKKEDKKREERKEEKEEKEEDSGTAVFSMFSKVLSSWLPSVS
eukprot:Skav213667  [mRNA]  locus=scaffold491:73281:73538:+ [translate_table: standard]